MAPLVDVRAIHHVAYTCSDLDASIAFWCDVLGFRVEGTFEVAGETFTQVNGIPGNPAARVALLSLHGTHRVELFEYSAPSDRNPRQPRPCDVGAHHIALHVADLSKAIEVCESHGWRRLGGDPIRPDGGPFKDLSLVYLGDGRGGHIELLAGEPLERS